MLASGRRELDEPHRANEFAWKTQVADGKVFDSALRLGAVKRVRRNAHLSHGVFFDAESCLYSSFSSILLTVPEFLHV